jgi:dolichol-phosphate mannosyltransferase
MPVYNEEASVGAVVGEWMPVLEALGERFVLLALDDGSRDGTVDVLRALQLRFPDRLVVSSHANRGHGQTCLEGYRHASALGASFVLQIDSDGQCDPRFLQELWRLRHGSTVIYGVRTRREDGVIRMAMSRALRALLHLRFGVDCRDANVPYRMMRTAAVIEAVNAIPASFDLANVALAALLASSGCTQSHVPITFRRRHGGRPSVSWPAFAGKALALYRDLAALLGVPSRGARTHVGTTSEPEDSACP